MTKVEEMQKYSSLEDILLLMSESCINLSSDALSIVQIQRGRKCPVTLDEYFDSLLDDISEVIACLNVLDPVSIEGKAFNDRVKESIDGLFEELSEVRRAPN